MLPHVWLWKKLTQKAMEQSSDKLETDFFESVYRLAYASGVALSDDQTISYRIYKIAIKMTIFLFVSSELWYLLEVTNSLDSVIESVNVIIIHFIVIYRYKSMEDCRHIYIKLAKSMESPTFDISTPGRKIIYLHWRKKYENCYRLVLSLASACLSFWYIYPLVDEEEYNLMVPLQLPVEYASPQRYPVAYSVMLLMFHLISCFVVVNDLMMQTYLIHMNCQFAVLADCFENIEADCCGDGQNPFSNKLFSKELFRQKYLQRLGDLVDQHKFLLNNSSDLRTILSRPMLGQLAASSILICLAGYQVTATLTGNVIKFLISLMYLSYNLLGFYLLCRWCDEIKTQSARIGQSVYFSGWERGAAVLPGVKARLMLVMARASCPLVLTAGGLYDVSVASYTTLVKTSYSALTVLLRMRKR